ncbi:DUF5957 family protein [Amycolatopsis arida]|uniref:DUF5957 family protein n=1 Tax=Amycolatopsis arida TaxID=587909 RepID=UPI000B887CF4|nr:DUF5957 family protein [Amycolatopsis arida]
MVGLLGGFVGGEALAAAFGLLTAQLTDSPGPFVWILRALPFVLAVVGAVAVPAVDARLRRKGDA